VFGRGHINEVDDDQAAHIPQAQLAGNFFRGFQVGLASRLFDVLALGGAGRVDIDRNQCLGGVYDDRAAGGEFDLALEGRLDLAFNLIAAEQGDLIPVQLILFSNEGMTARTKFSTSS
jgi:hypothetical protein